MADNIDLCLWIRCAADDGNDQALYDNTLGQYDTDFPRDLERTTPPSRKETKDFYGADGRSLDKGVPGGSTTVTKEEMPYKKHDSTGWTGGLRGTSDATQTYSDSSTSSAPEGESWGLGASYGAAEIMINFYGKRAAAASSWVSPTTQFSDFIEAAPQLLGTHKQAGISRVAAEEAVKAEYPALFAKFSWMPSILSRFADSVFGTAPKPKCEVESIGQAIDECVANSLRSGASRQQAEKIALAEFEAWAEQDPAVPVHIQACLDMRYAAGRTSSSATQMDLFLADNPETPVEYQVFRSWCVSHSVDGTAYVTLERTALQMHLVEIPDMLEKVADKANYISDPNSPTPKLKTVETQPGQALPAEVKDDDGSTLKKVPNQ